MFEHVPYGVVVLESATGRILLANDTVCALLGCPLDELIGASFSAFAIDPDSLLPFLAASGGPVAEAGHGECRLLTRTGEERVAVIAARRFESERLDALAVGLWDVTPRRSAMDAFRQKTALAEVLQAVAIALNEAKTPDEAVQGVLEQICLYTGWPSGQAYAQGGGGLQPAPLPQRYPRNGNGSGGRHAEPDSSVPPAVQGAGVPAEDPDVAGALAARGLAARVAAAGRADWGGLEETPADPGPKTGSGRRAAYGFPIFRAGRVEYVLLFHSTADGPPDAWAIELMSHVGNLLARSLERIRDRQALEEALRRSEERLRHAQKMEAVGALAGGVAHAFNNLLTVVSAQGQLLAARLAPGDPIRKRAEEIRAAAARGGVLTRQLLTFARKEVWSPEELDLNTAVAETAAMLGSVLGEHVEVSIEPAPEEARVRIDRGHLEQILFNLASNARDAMPRGGRLRVAVSNVIEDGAAGVAGALPPGPCSRITVSDSGRGMDEETRRRIFEPFFTTKEIHHGAGLGLATVYSLVERNGGSIEVVSEPGSGTTFRIHLPRAEAQGAPDPSPRAASAPGTAAETILLVEDEDTVRSVSRELLESEGHRVLEAPDGVEALRVSGDYAGEIDLLLTDVVMPRMGGGELAERLAVLRPDTRVLFVSGFAGDELSRRGVPNGSAFIHKPFTLESMSLKIREVLDSPRARSNGGTGAPRGTTPSRAPSRE